LTRSARSGGKSGPARARTTQIRFTHVGLVPDYECYDLCRDAWGTYIRDSLRSLIQTGKGRPSPDEDDLAATELRGRLAATR
jgi:hypothetical protein